MLFGQINKDRLNSIIPGVFDEDNENMKSAKDSVENMFNVQYDKLNPKTIKHEEKGNCCCPKDINVTKPSYRLKKSLPFPPEQAEEDNNSETSPCNCKCPERNHGGQIRKIIGKLGDKKLKISAKL